MGCSAQWQVMLAGDCGYMKENYHIGHPRAQKCWNQSIQLPKLVATQYRVQKVIM